MASRYDRIVRLYSSWIGDLEDPDKCWTASERWAVVYTLCRCQMDESLDALHALPPEIRRGLSMATLETQLEKLISARQTISRRGRGKQEVGVDGADEDASPAEKKKKPFAQWIKEEPDDKVVWYFTKKEHTPSMDKMLQELRPDLFEYLKSKGVKLNVLQQ